MPKFEGTVEEIVFRNDANGWTVASFRLDGSGRTSAVGILPFLSAGEHVILDGELVEHRDYGEQIKVSSYEIARPETKSGVEKYLGSGLIKGVGPATAKLIVKHFGVDTLDVLESEPHRLTEIPGIGPKKAAMIAESFAMQNEMRATLIFLQGAGLTPAMAMKVYKAYGDQSEAVLRKNPYRLADEIDGVGFQTADHIARGMGFTPETPQRLMSGVRYVLSEAVNRMGHMYLPMEELLAQAVEVLGVGNDLVEHTVRSLLVSGELIEEAVEGDRAVYLPKGVWFDYYTGKRYSGGRYVLAEAPLDRMPLFARGGAVIPVSVGKPQSVEDIREVVLEVFPGNGRFVHYMDDGETMAYLDGELRALQVSVRGRRTQQKIIAAGYPGPESLRIQWMA